MKYKIGFYQFQPEFLDVQSNLQKIENKLHNIKADLIVLPELATTGYSFTCMDDVKKVSEPAQNGDTANLFRKLAKENNTSYVVGFSEHNNNLYFNSSMLINPDGKIYVYRKSHLFYEEKKWFTPGDSGLQVFPAKNDVKVGLMICFDWIFPESARTLALKGAQIIAHSANLVLPWCQQAMITRSLENRVFSVTANRTGSDDGKLTFTGMSQILSTKGEIVHRADENEEKVHFAEINTEDALDKNVTEFNHIFSDRRPDLYYS